jgi:phage shock protein PspC (stress-responsive transcriptional regulator)
VLAGVCGGVGEYFDIDPVLIRLLYLMITLFTAVAPGIVCYLIAIAIVPKAPTIEAPVVKQSIPEVHDTSAV